MLSLCAKKKNKKVSKKKNAIKNYDGKNVNIKPWTLSQSIVQQKLMLKEINNQ